MTNSLIDAYIINCDAMDKAEQVFMNMQNGTVAANRRTYNTMLKGWVKRGDLPRAQMLAAEISELKFWDANTTNTLVGEGMDVLIPLCQYCAT
jgi:PPR repeat family